MDGPRDAPGQAARDLTGRAGCRPFLILNGCAGVTPRTAPPDIPFTGNTRHWTSTRGKGPPHEQADCNHRPRPGARPGAGPHRRRWPEERRWQPAQCGLDQDR
ncbi:hypothetical protein G6F62_015463 [Rhizopus arrhizus]|nr:hypothetical protein G6F62_015463 [Rhizopus arrhizus]